MKTISNISEQPGHVNLSARVFSLALILALTLFTEKQVKAQNYTINYFDVNLDAQALAYYPPQKCFVVSSMKEGQLGYIDSEGRYKLFLKDDKLIGATGLKVRDNFLYVLTGNSTLTSKGDPAFGKDIKLIKINLLDKTIVSTYELDKLYSGPHYITDLVIDNEGIVYITDAFCPVIYKVSPNGVTSILLTDKRLNSQNNQNKPLTYHKNGYLLVAVNSDILKIDLTNNNSISRVFVEEGFDDINSIHFTTNYLLALSEGGDSRKVHILNSSNSWASANILRTDIWNYNSPVNLDFFKNKIFVLDANIEKVSDADFSVRVIDLKKYPKKKGKKGRVVAGDISVARKGF
ncbi:hypothetical protein WG906_07495 [Pedobacter sp. P351]|uniref:hypothetical protein n=1 Tax=Pedobacter superstes TaxID=3133441 RepID=UPI00309FF003